MRRMGFGPKWMKWMEATVFTSSMLVLVNGSPTLDFQDYRRLHQGGTMSPFLFLLATNGLVGLNRNAVYMGDFKGFQVKEDIQYELL